MSFGVLRFKTFWTEHFCQAVFFNRTRKKAYAGFDLFELVQKLSTSSPQNLLKEPTIQESTECIFAQMVIPFRVQSNLGFFFQVVDWRE